MTVLYIGIHMLRCPDEAHNTRIGFFQPYLGYTLDIYIIPSANSTIRVVKHFVILP